MITLCQWLFPKTKTKDVSRDARLIMDYSYQLASFLHRTYKEGFSDMREAIQKLSDAIDALAVDIDAAFFDRSKAIADAIAAKEAGDDVDLGVLFTKLQNSDTKLKASIQVVQSAVPTPVPTPVEPVVEPVAPPADVVVDPAA